MAATTLSADSLPTEGTEIRRGLLIRLARLMAAAYCMVGAGYAMLWVVHPSVADAVDILSMAALVGVSLAAASVAASGRTNLGGYLLTGGVIVVTAVSALALLVAARSFNDQPAMSSVFAISANCAVAVVLGGLLLPRSAVIGLAGVAFILFSAQVVVSATGRSASATPNVLSGSILGVLSFFLLLSLLASEYAARLGLVMAKLDARTKDAEGQARALEQAKAEVERRMVELAAAKQEIERKREVGLSVASEIAAMARELAAASSQHASGSSQQTAAMSEIVATVEELSRTAGQIAANSAQVAQLVSAALQSAEMGRQAVDETIAGLDRIRAEVRSVAEKNLVLGQKTQAIGEIIEVITEIADRTHLLALNAAIESAGAGEYGRRFGVVASQVKELANEAKAAAHQVRAAVAEIQRAANATVLAAEKSESEVEAGVGLGHGARDGMMAIVEIVQDVARAVKEVSLATQQQQSASEQVVATVREIDLVIRQSAEGNRQIAQAVAQLMAAAERLK